MIEKLIQDNVVVLRTIHSFCQKIKLVLLRDEVEVLQVLDLLARKKLDSSTAMVDENEMQVFFLLAFGARCSLTVNWFATVTFG